MAASTLWRSGSRAAASVVATAVASSLPPSSRIGAGMSIAASRAAAATACRWISTIRWQGSGTASGRRPAENSQPSNCVRKLSRSESTQIFCRS